MSFPSTPRKHPGDGMESPPPTKGWDLPSTKSSDHGDTPKPRPASVGQRIVGSHDRIVIDHAGFPHILGAIIAASSGEALYSLRATSHHVRARVDTHLAKVLHHVALSHVPGKKAVRITALDGSALPLRKSIFTCDCPAGVGDLCIAQCGNNTFGDTSLALIRRADVLDCSRHMLCAIKLMGPVDVLRLHPPALRDWSKYLTDRMSQISSYEIRIGTVVLFIGEGCFGKNLATQDDFDFSTVASVNKLVIRYRYNTEVTTWLQYTRTYTWWTGWTPKLSRSVEAELVTTWGREGESGNEGIVTRVGVRSWEEDEEDGRRRLISQDDPWAYRAYGFSIVVTLFAATSRYLRDVCTMSAQGLPPPPIPPSRTVPMNMASGKIRVEFKSLDEYAELVGQEAFQLETDDCDIQRPC